MKNFYQKIENALFETDYKSWQVFLIYLTVSLLVFSPSFLNLNYFWDDERFIFSNPEVYLAPNWHSFWNQKSEFFKTWPLGYATFWVFIKSGVINLFFYKTLNIFLHTINAFLIYKLCKTYKSSSSLMLPLLFLVHPLHVETVSWIFQLLTILAIAFFLCSAYCLSKYVLTSRKIFLIISLCSFLFSLWTKSIALLAPIAFLVFVIITTKSLKKTLLLIPFFFLSLYIGFQNQKGASLYTQHPGEHKSKIFDVLENSFNGIFQPVGKIITNNDRAYLDFTYKRQRPTNDTRIKPQFESMEIFKQGLAHYSLKLFFPINLNFMYPAQKLSPIVIFVFLGFFLVVPLILWMKFNQVFFTLIPTFTLVSLLPYLGISNIPFFYWSRVSDRYTYFFCLIIVLIGALLMTYLKNKYLKKIMVLFLLFFLVNNIWYGFKFSNPNRIYIEILAFKKHPVIYSLIIEKMIEKSDLSKSESYLKEALIEFPDDELIKVTKMRVESFKNNLQLLNKQQ